MINVGKPLLLLFFINIIDLIPFQVFLMSLLLLLRKSVKYCCLKSLRRVESVSGKKEYSFSLWISGNLELSNVFVKFQFLFIELS